jgi:hypothetical protein
MRTVFLPQQLPLHAKYGIDDLLLLASHDDEASGQFLYGGAWWTCRIVGSVVSCAGDNQDVNAQDEQRHAKYA